jgi:hypothetical protein
MLFSQFAKSRKASALILGKESGDVLFRVSDKMGRRAQFVPDMSEDRLAARDDMLAAMMTPSNAGH